MLLAAHVEAPRPAVDEAEDIAATAVVEAAAPLEAADAVAPAVDAPKPVPMCRHITTFSSDSVRNTGPRRFALKHFRSLAEHNRFPVRKSQEEPTEG